MNKKDKRKIRALTGLLVLALVVVGSFVSVKAASPKLNKKKATVTIGKTVKLKVKNTGSKVKWTSSNKKVATVKKSGKYGAAVTGKKAGKATITAKVGSKKLKCRVTVKAGLNKTSVSLKKGETSAIQVKGVKKTVKWSSSNKKVAVVTKLGKYKAKITAKKAGTTTIKAKVGSMIYKCKVKVTADSSSNNKNNDIVDDGSGYTVSAAAQKIINEAVASFVKEGMTDQEKAYQLALYVCDNLDHYYESFIYGDEYSSGDCIIKGKAVAMGYAQLYIKLLAKAGIRSKWVTGDYGLRNKVMIDGKWYNVDLYRMDPNQAKPGERQLCYGFFLFSDQAALKYFSDYYKPGNHKTFNPVADSTRFDFYEITFNKAKADGSDIIWANDTADTFSDGIDLYKYNPWVTGEWKNY